MKVMAAAKERTRFSTRSKPSGCRPSGKRADVALPCGGGNQHDTTHLAMKTTTALLLRLHLTNMEVDVQSLLHGNALPGIPSPHVRAARHNVIFDLLRRLQIMLIDTFCSREGSHTYRCRYCADYSVTRTTLCPGNPYTPAGLWINPSVRF